MQIINMGSRLRKGIILLLLGWICGWPNSVLSSEPPLRIVTSLDGPFVFVDDNGKLSGYAVELIEQVQQQLGETVSIEVYPWARTKHILDTEPNVLAFSVVKTDNRGEEYHWLTPISRNVYALFGHKDNQFEINRLADLARLQQIGVLRGDFREQVLVDAGLTNLHAFNSWDQALESLLLKRLDGVFFSAAGVDLLCREDLIPKGYATCLQDITPLYIYRVIPSFVVMSKQSDKALVARWQAAFERYKGERAYVLMAKRWQDTYHRQGMRLSFANGAFDLWQAQ